MHILACIDPSAYATSVINHAGWAAQCTGGTVEVLHAIQRKDAVAARHDLSGAVGLGAKSALLDELVRIDETDAKLARERGHALLHSAQDELNAAGVGNVVLTHRHGGIVETVEERSADADLIVLGKRGASSGFAKDHLGSKVERVVRSAPKPVLIAPRAYTRPQRVIVGFDGSESAGRAADFAASAPLLSGLPVEVIAAGHGHAEPALEVLRTQLPNAEFRTDAGTAVDAIGSAAETGPPPIVLIGAYGQSRLRSFFVGSTTSALILGCHAPILLFR